MKNLSKLFLIVLSVALFIGSTGCKTTVKSTRTKSATTTSGLPPGQAKKLNGDKSAKKYAPGQQKKKNKKKKH